MAERKRSSTTPTKRTLDLLRRQGWQAEVVERRIPRTRKAKDLFGFIDVLGINDTDTVGFQVTSGSNVAARIAKITALPTSRAWLQAGRRLFVHGWAKRGPHGKRKLWKCREIELFLVDGDIVRSDA